MPAVGVPAPDVCLVSSGLCAKAILHKTEHAIADVNGCTVADVNAVSISIRLRSTATSILYRVPEIVTRGRFPDGGESDSTWRTQEARHVGSDTIAPGF